MDLEESPHPAGRSRSDGIAAREDVEDENEF